jgi:hypothetical protein
MEGGSLRGQIAEWKVLISLDAPVMPPQLHSGIEKIRLYISQLRQRGFINAVTQAQWDQRIQGLKQRMVPSRIRNRRGILDFVGGALNFLFGTATEDQVKECQTYIQKLHHRQERVVHLTEKLITVVNQTYEEVRKNRQQITQLWTYLSHVSATISKLTEAVTSITGRLDNVETRLELDSYLGALEAIHRDWTRLLDKYISERASLELGWLTESILPPSELLRILRFGQVEGLYAPPIQWYYEYVRITPLWEDPSRLVFTVNLPFISKVEYLRYKLKSWPVRSNDGEAVIHLQVPPEVALDTMTGGMFYPRGCVGHNPLICRTGPVYRKGQMSCPRGIISGDKQQRLRCEVTIQTEIKETVEEIEPGRFVFSTKGEQFRLHCPGESEIGHYLVAGVYQITLTSGCRLVGPEWHIEGLLQRYTELSFWSPNVTVLPFGLNNILPSDFVKINLKPGEISKIPELPPLSLFEVTGGLPEKAEPLTWGKTTGSLVFLYFIITIVCCIFIGMLAFQINKRLGWDCKKKVKSPWVTSIPPIPLQQVQDGIFVSVSETEPIS